MNFWPFCLKGYHRNLRRTINHQSDCDYLIRSEFARHFDTEQFLSEAQADKLTELACLWASLYGIGIQSIKVEKNGIKIIARSFTRPPSEEDAKTRWIEFWGRYYRNNPKRYRQKIKEMGKPGFISRLLLRLRDISGFMHDLKMCFAQWYNQRFGHIGAVWARRFSTTKLENDSLSSSHVGVVSASSSLLKICDLPRSFAGIRSYFAPCRS